MDKEERKSSPFSKLELVILEESRLRGENLYRLSCRIDSSEVLPHSRAFKLCSQLETGMNLIKSDPPLDSSEDCSHLTFWLTTKEPESAILQAAHIDLVHVDELVELQYHDLARARDGSSAKLTASRQSELKSASDDELEQSHDRLDFFPIKPFLLELNATLRELSVRNSIQARFEWRLALKALDTAKLEALRDILRHLMRNAVQHGIEKPHERLELGKKECALIFFELRKKDECIECVFEDDGRGIDEEAIFARIQVSGEDISRDKTTLLDALTNNTLNDVKSSENQNGRGFGFEIVRSLIKKAFKSDLIIENNPGKSLRFSWKSA